ncbi:hypothetical protein SPRA44_600138 [Serratia proteamaculans]|nr:hypothetical protein SPRA44_600138 [Serratia proteamaculans]
MAFQHYNAGYVSIAKKYGRIPPTASAITPEQRRIQELEKQVHQLQSDNDLLKKASAFLAMEMNSDKSRGETGEGRGKYLQNGSREPMEMLPRHWGTLYHWAHPVVGGSPEGNPVG